jgi:hypothetical protein
MPGIPVILAAASTGSPGELCDFSNNNDAALVAFFPEIVLTPVGFYLTISSASHPEIKACKNPKISLGLWVKEEEKEKEMDLILLILPLILLAFQELEFKLSIHMHA